MPLKTPKPKSQQQIEELLELLQWRLDSQRPCDCNLCMIDRALYRVSIDALLWTRGKGAKGFLKLIHRLKQERVSETKYQHAHSE